MNGIATRKSVISALASESWQKHRGRLLLLGASLLAFALFYPFLWSLSGLNPGNLNALDEIAAKIKPAASSRSSLAFVAQIIGVLFLLLGPLGFMIVSQLYVIWIFTAMQVDAVKGFSFPPRYFTLPVPTRLLAGWFMGGGIVTLTLLHLGWTRLVLLPRIEVFDGYQNPLVWIALLIVSQAIVWGLDAFPVTRLLLLTGAIFAAGFLGGPAVQDHPFFEHHRTSIVIGSILIGCPLALIGLHKIRHGCWQRMTWPFFRSPPVAGPKSDVRLGHPQLAGFASAFRAQVWFEWRRQSRKLVFYVSVLSGVPLLVYVVLALISQAKLNSDTVVGLGGYLLLIPAFVHFVSGLDPERGVPPFTALRPLRNDELAAAKLTAIALGSLLSWMVTLGMIAVLPLIGDTHDINRCLRQMMETWPIAVVLPLVLLGPIFIMWRFAAADLCFGFAGKPWVSKILVLKSYVAGMAIVSFIFLSRDANMEKVLIAAVPFLLGAMLIFKFALAQMAFRHALRRALLDRSLMVTYLSAWLLLAAAFLTATVALFHGFKWVLSASLGIVLALPLARIAFAPIAAGLGRHR